MLGLRVKVRVDAAELVPAPRNVLNELDGVATALGIRRYQGEKTRDFREAALQIGAAAKGESDRVDLLAGLESRITPVSLVLESLSATASLRASVTESRWLKIRLYKPGQFGSLFYYKDYDYDLLDRTSYPFLEDLVARVTADIPEARAYINPFSNERNNSLLPEHLCVCRNVAEGSDLFPDATTFLLRDKFLIPDSVRLLVHSPPSGVTLTQQDTVAKVVGAGDWHLDYWTGKVTVAKSWDSYQAVLFYEYVRPVSFLVALPGLSLLSLGNSDTLTRVLSSTPEGQPKKRLYRAGAVTNGLGEVTTCPGLSARLHDALESLPVDNNHLTWG